VDAPLNTGRLPWLDAVKAIGIVAVVWGHVVGGPAARYVYLWHMPLFFFIAGYVFRPDPNLRRHLRDKAIRLLLPYFMFLILLSGHDIAVTAQAGTAKDWALFVATHLSGGKSIYGWLAPFWFVTCLFLTQQAVNLGMVRLRAGTMIALMGVSLLLAYVNAAWLPRAWLPWAANVCLFAAPVFCLGHWFRQHASLESTRWLSLCAPLSAVGLLLVGMDVIAAPDMKYTRYGVPVVSLVFALGICIGLMAAARRWLGHGPLAHGLARIGQASLMIMFLHMAVQFLLLEQLHLEGRISRVILALAIPLLVYIVLERNMVTRALFLGSVKDFDALARYATTDTALRDLRAK